MVTGSRPLDTGGDHGEPNGGILLSCMGSPSVGVGVIDYAQPIISACSPNLPLS